MKAALVALRQDDTTLPETEPPRLITQEEVAQMMGVGIETIRKWRREGKIGFIRIGRVVRFEPEAIAAFLTAHRHTGPVVEPVPIPNIPDNSLVPE